MAHEYPSQPENLTLGFIELTETSFDELLKHSIWNVGMPLETPLRWHLGEYVGEDSPRNIELWILLDEKTTIYLTKILRQVEQEDGSWKVHAKEILNDGTVYFSNADISEDGLVSKSQFVYDSDDNESVKLLAGSDINYTTEQLSEILVRINNLLQQACSTMPDKQEEFMSSLDQHKLDRALLFQSMFAK
jgi:Fe-S cluster assembly iron-binding protein IscA